MIFAPRSCPSRPGFATTTRIFLPPWPDAAGVSSAVPSTGGGGLGLEDGCLDVAAEDLLEGADDLTLGRVDTRALEQRVHQVGVALRSLLEPRERGLDLGA